MVDKSGADVVLFFVCCVPVWMDPTFPERVAREDSDHAHHYTQAPCHICNKPVWLGQRGRKLVDEGAYLVCMVCGHHLYKDLGVESTSMIPLTSIDKEH